MDLGLIIHPRSYNGKLLAQNPEQRRTDPNQLAYTPRSSQLHPFYYFWRKCWVMRFAGHPIVHRLPTKAETSLIREARGIRRRRHMLLSSLKGLARPKGSLKSAKLDSH